MWHDLIPYLSKHEAIAGSCLVFIIGAWTQWLAFLNYLETRRAQKRREQKEDDKEAGHNQEEGRLLAAAIDTHIRYDLLMEACPVAIIVAGGDGKITDWTDAACSLLGWTGHEARGKPLTLIIPKDLRPQHLASFQEYLETGEAHIIGRPVNIRALHKDGHILNVTLCVGAGQETDGKQFFCGFLFATPPTVSDLQGRS